MGGGVKDGVDCLGEEFLAKSTLVDTQGGNCDYDKMVPIAVNGIVAISVGEADAMAEAIAPAIAHGPLRITGDGFIIAGETVKGRDKVLVGVVNGSADEANAIPVLVGGGLFQDKDSSEVVEDATRNDGLGLARRGRAANNSARCCSAWQKLSASACERNSLRLGL